MTGEVPTELCALPRFRSKLQLDKLFDGFWASVKGVVSRIYVKFPTQAGLIDGQGSDLRPFIHCHDMSAFSRCRVRPARLPDGRIWCYLQAFYIALA